MQPHPHSLGSVSGLLDKPLCCAPVSWLSSSLPPSLPSSLTPFLPSISPPFSFLSPLPPFCLCKLSAHLQWWGSIILQVTRFDSSGPFVFENMLLSVCRLTNLFKTSFPGMDDLSEWEHPCTQEPEACSTCCPRQEGHGNRTDRSGGDTKWSATACPRRRPGREPLGVLTPTAWLTYCYWLKPARKAPASLSVSSALYYLASWSQRRRDASGNSSVEHTLKDGFGASR